MKRSSTIKKVILTIPIVIFAGVTLITVLSIFGIPQNLKIYVVETGSMEPNIGVGALTFVSPEEEYKVGDVITFMSRLEPEGPKIYTITHRILEVSEENGDIMYITKGDANDAPDALLANKIDVIGRVNYNIPYIGYVIGFAKTKVGFMSLILIPSVLIIYSELINISKELKNINLKKKRNLGLHFNL